MTDQYVDPKYARASYRPQNIMSSGLRRAREPFRLRNALTGVALAGFAVGVWAYSIGAVKQDAFDDVDEEARALMVGSGIQKAEETQKAVDVLKETGAVPAPTFSAPLLTTPESRSRRGILPPLLEHHIPRLFDPATGTLVWGAPPVDDIGKVGERSAGSRRVV